MSIPGRIDALRDMRFELLLTVGVLVGALALLMTDTLSADAVLLGGLVVVVLGGVIDLERALQRFGNATLLALGSLYVVAAGLRETGALDIASSYVLGETRGVRRLLLRMCPSVTVCSAFLNNTPVVAMGIPAIRGWCKRHGVSPSKLLMPLSYSAILGGICTLIGTSTNLVVHGLLQSHGMEGFGFFELAWVGGPCAVVGLLYIILVAPALTPERADIRAEEEERADLVEIELVPDSPLVGETVGETDLKLLPGLTLAQLEPGAERIAPVASDETLQAGDRLLFTTSKMGESSKRCPTKPSRSSNRANVWKTCRTASLASALFRDCATPTRTWNEIGVGSCTRSSSAKDRPRCRGSPRVAHVTEHSLTGIPLLHQFRFDASLLLRQGLRRPRHRAGGGSFFP